MLSFVIVGFIWQLILSPIWGISKGFLDLLGLGFLFQPWLGKPETALDHARADLRLAVYRHPDDALLRRTDRHPG